MSSRQKLPPHGTPERYRLERKAGTTCDRCKARMAALRKEQRANRSASEARARMHIVESPSDDTVNDTDPPAQKSNPRSRTRRDQRTKGEMEKAVDEDIDEIDSSIQVPFHRSLSVLARQLARDIDEPSTPANVRSQYSRQLFEVLRSLRTQKEGDDNSAVAVALQATGFGSGPPKLP